MRAGTRAAALSLIFGALVSPLAITACAHPHHEHVWSDGESAYYVRWEGETHRDHRDFNARPGPEQQEYWSWRDSHR